MEIGGYGFNATAISQLRRKTLTSAVQPGVVAGPKGSAADLQAPKAPQLEAKGVGSVGGEGLSIGSLDEGRKVETGPSFREVLASFQSVDAQAQTQMNDYARGKEQNLHETMLTLTKAEIGFNLLVSVRNKLLDAYQQVMRMS